MTHVRKIEFQRLELKLSDHHRKQTVRKRDEQRIERNERISERKLVRCV